MEVYFKNLTPEDGTADKLLHDLRTLSDDTEELFRVTGVRLAEKSKRKFLAALERARSACQEMRNQAAAGAAKTDRAIREYPYPAAGIALGVGVLVGMLMLRRSPGRQ